MLDFSHVSITVGIVLLTVLTAEASTGWSDASTGTSAAVASGAVTSRQALWITALSNFVGLLASLLIGAAVAKTIGTGIVRPEVISIYSIGIAMCTTITWAVIAVSMGLPISKTHSLLAALAGIGYAQGGFDALLPASGHISDSGWIAVMKGVFFAVICGSALSWFLAQLVIATSLEEKISEIWWRRIQRVTVCLVGSGHGFNDGLKYVGIFTLVLYKSSIIERFEVRPEVVVLCAIVMGAGTLLGGWRIHRRLDGMVNGTHPQLGKKAFRPYMGVSSELVAAVSIWQSGWLGIPMSTNHAVVSAMAGARSATGKVHLSSVVKILWGWVVTYIFCFFVADALTFWLVSYPVMQH